MTKTRSVPRPERKRINQPANYTGARLIRKHKCRRHDYVYYGENWVDAATGTEYLKGYYDEKGNRYDALIIDNNGSLESQFDCRYCGTSTKEKWTEGSIPHCPNCGSLLIETADNVITDVIDNSTVDEQYEEEVTDYGSSPAVPTKKVGCLLALMFLSPVILFASRLGIAMFSSHDATQQKQHNSQQYNNEYVIEEQIDDYRVVGDNIDLFGDSFYVESIGRDITFNWEYGYYYDAPSDCYLIYNTEMEPAVWQYWYEGISSDYGDYGWMEYEISEDTWYIEASEDNWIVLPSRYDTSVLWHMTGTDAGTSYIQDYDLEMLGSFVKVDDDTAYYEWSDDMGGYEITSHDCYLYVNYDASPEVIQYWYDSISDEYCVDGYGGWLEYDYDEEIWYAEDENGNWIVLSGDECEGLWHVEESVTGITGTVAQAY